MSAVCECHDIVFEPAPGGGPGAFQAKIHPDAASLKQCAEGRTCHLCVVLYGMLENRRRFWPVGGVGYHRTWEDLDVSLWLYYEVEGDGNWNEDTDNEDWDLFGEELHGDYPSGSSIKIHHPLGCDELLIRNPEVVSRAAWDSGGEITSPVSSYTSDTQQPPLVSSDPKRRDFSTGSDVSLEHAQKWVTTCRNTHPECGKRSTEAEYTPTRLLDVSRAMDKSTGIVTLVDSAQLVAACEYTNPSVQYATLSHRWDPNYNVSTTTSNVHHHQTTGISIDHLPKTFAEACITTRKLGLRYIWIDSLCIVQDMKADKAVEIPKMADYYQGADLNLSASSETLGGLWSYRDGAATRPFVLNATLVLPGLRKQSQVVLELAPKLRAVKSHLDYRGWILQERIFPRRTLFFDAYWVAFQCGRLAASDACPEGVELDVSSNQVTVDTALATDLGRDCNLSIIGGIVRSVDPSSAVKDQATRQHILTLWYRILHEYSLRQLSFETDRLDAISGLAARLSLLLDDTYLGGLWQSNLLECLQWRRGNPYNSVYYVRQRGYRAPTWSWASSELLPQAELTSGVSNDFVAGGASTPLVDIRGVQHTDCAEAANPFGALMDAVKLSLVGRPLRAFAYEARAPDMGLQLDTLADGEVEEESLAGGEPRGAIGMLRDRAAVWLHISGRTTGGERARTVLPAWPDASDTQIEGYVYLLPLAERSLPGVLDCLFCLVLREVGPGTFERVGHAMARSCDVIKVAARDMVLV